MTYQTFEGKKSIRYVGSPDDKASFDKIKDQLGFINDMDFYSFCVSVAMILEDNGKDISRVKLKKPKKMVGMETFTKNKLFDQLLINYFEIEDYRLEEFETYFYTGFKIIEKWFEEERIRSEYQLELFCDLFDYLTND